MKKLGIEDEKSWGERADKSGGILTVREYPEFSPGWEVGYEQVATSELSEKGAYILDGKLFPHYQHP
jgi:hypothetical protein